MDWRPILEFFTREAPQLGITKDVIENVNIHVEKALQMYYFIADLIFTFEEYQDVTNEYARITVTRRLFQVISGLFNDISINDNRFQIQDLLIPKVDRTKYFLYQLILFYKFRCDREIELQKIYEEKENQDRDVALEEMCATTSGNMLAQMQSHVTEIEKQLEEAVQKELGSLQLMMLDTKNEFSSKKAESDECNAKLNQLGHQIAEEKQKAARLDANIVNSPARIVADIKHLERELDLYQRKLETIVHEKRRTELAITNQNVAFELGAQLRDELNQMLAVNATVKQWRLKLHEKAKILERSVHDIKKMRKEINDFELKNKADIHQLNNEQNVNKRNEQLLVKQTEKLLESINDMKKLISDAREEKETCKLELKDVDKQLNELGENFDKTFQTLENFSQGVCEKIYAEENATNTIIEYASRFLNKEN